MTATVATSLAGCFSSSIVILGMEDEDTVLAAVGVMLGDATPEPGFGGVGGPGFLCRILLSAAVVP